MEAVRIVLSADVAHGIWQSSMDDRYPYSVVRDAAFVIFAFIFGLRKSSVLEVKMEDIRCLDNMRMEIIVRKLKGRTAQEAIRRGPRTYRVPSSLQVSTPLSLMTKYVSMRASSSGYLFASRAGQDGPTSA